VKAVIAVKTVIPVKTGTICVFVSGRHWLLVVLAQAGNQHEQHGFPLPKGTGMTGEQLRKTCRTSAKNSQQMCGK